MIGTFVVAVFLAFTQKYKLTLGIMIIGNMIFILIGEIGYLIPNPMAFYIGFGG